MAVTPDPVMIGQLMNVSCTSSSGASSYKYGEWSLNTLAQMYSSRLIPYFKVKGGRETKELEFSKSFDKLTSFHYIRTVADEAAFTSATKVLSEL